MIKETSKKNPLLIYANELTKDIKGPKLDEEEIRIALRDYKKGKREELEEQIESLTEELEILRRSNEELYANIIYLNRSNYY